VALRMYNYFWVGGERNIGKDQNKEETEKKRRNTTK
jgi:hypothetical protein